MEIFENISKRIIEKGCLSKRLTPLLLSFYLALQLWLRRESLIGTIWLIFSDLKPENILMKNKDLKLCDFGFAKAS